MVNFKISEAANDSFSGKKRLDIVIFINRGGPRNPATFKMEFFAAIFNGFQPTIAVKSFTSNVTGLLKPHMQNGEIGVSVK